MIPEGMLHECKWPSSLAPNTDNFVVSREDSKKSYGLEKKHTIILLATLTGVKAK